MKLALFSDIHSNLPALDALFQDIDDKKPDSVYCLGDLVGYNIWPNEVINQIRKHRIPTIAGNYDFGIGRKSDDCGCAYKTNEEREMGKISISFTNDTIGESQREYLKNLPRHIRLELLQNDEKLNLLLVHGSPRRINEYLFEDRDEKSLLRIMEQADADIMCFGHTHKPYHRILKSGTEDSIRYRHAVNIGSVGKPKDGDPRGCYVILSLDETTSIKDNSSVGVDFIRFNYNIEKAAAAVEDSVLPDEYAMLLRNAY